MKMTFYASTPVVKITSNNQWGIMWYMAVNAFTQLHGLPTAFGAGQTEMQANQMHR
jgi:hypothetical protein